MKHFFLFSAFLLFGTSVSFSQQKQATHTITKGETPYFISKKYNVSLEELYKLNPTAVNGVQENQVLLLPKALEKNANATLKTHIVKEKETLFGLSQLYKVGVDVLQNANAETLAAGLKIGQQLLIPESNVVETKKAPLDASKQLHDVLAKESLFSIARKYNVSVEDLQNLNATQLQLGLQIGQKLAIPNKRKTVDGRLRVINKETIFHVVESKETKYSIAKKYGITIAQLESQNPEIVNNLVVGNSLAINLKQIEPTTESEELMLALADKQVGVEKAKAKTVEIADLKDRLTVQKEMNQKIIKINDLKVNLDEMDDEKTNPVSKLKLVLEANKNVQAVLMAKLDSLVVAMKQEITDLKNNEVMEIEEAKKLEEQTYLSVGKTQDLSGELRKELGENRKAYADLMNKVLRVSVEQNKEYKNKVRTIAKRDAMEVYKAKLSWDDITKYNEEQEKNAVKNEQLIEKIDSLESQKKIEIKRSISKATHYTKEAREFDDKLALLKLKRYQSDVVNTLDEHTEESFESKTAYEIRKYLEENPIKTAVEHQTFDNLKEQENGFYIVVGSFTNAKERDELVMKLLVSGDFNASFFYNINTLSYYVYADVYEMKEKALYKIKLKEGDAHYQKVILAKLKLDENY